MLLRRRADKHQHTCTYAHCARPHTLAQTRVFVLFLFPRDRLHAPQGDATGALNRRPILSLLYDVVKINGVAGLWRGFALGGVPLSFGCFNWCVGGEGMGAQGSRGEREAGRQGRRLASRKSVHVLLFLSVLSAPPSFPLAMRV